MDDNNAGEVSDAGESDMMYDMLHDPYPPLHSQSSPLDSWPGSIASSKPHGRKRDHEDELDAPEAHSSHRRRFAAVSEEEMEIPLKFSQRKKGGSFVSAAEVLSKIKHDTSKLKAFKDKGPFTNLAKVKESLGVRKELVIKPEPGDRFLIRNHHNRGIASAAESSPLRRPVPTDVKTLMKIAWSGSPLPGLYSEASRWKNIASQMKDFHDDQMKKDEDGEDDDIDEEPTSSKQTSKSKTRLQTLIPSRGLDMGKAPLSDIYKINDDIVVKAEKQGLETAFPSQKLRIFTMCSGTESPLCALRLLQAALERRGKEYFKFAHLGSAEIEPFKQAYIQRNFEPTVLFRDVIEFIEKADPHTAYGGTAKPPKGVHILIAGSSCVDFSVLNQKRKETLEEEGQSYLTLKGIASYAERHEPNMIILENVDSAPWGGIIDFLDDHGYYAHPVRVDTKNFYLPHTRNRGYVVAFDKRRLKRFGKADKFDLNKACKMWVDCMGDFQQRATAPFTDFLIQDDDPCFDLERSAFERSLKGCSRNMDWVACRHRYGRYRVEQQLGPRRPMTLWQNNGSCIFPDFGWLKWATVMRERVWDTLDIQYLRHVADRHYDMNFKCRSLDLSQNVDRDTDNRPWGIIGCVTPEGQPYLTSRGCVITGKEALALQGLPVQDLTFTREDSKQLQDLAGNAMSTPVIGCAMLSAILAAYYGKISGDEPFFEDFSSLELPGQAPGRARTANSPPAELFETLVRRSGADIQEAKIVSLEALEKPTLNKILSMAAKTFRLCRCEGSSERKKGPFQLCRACAHISCKICGKNPRHLYRDLSVDKIDRLLAGEFVGQITKALPASLRVAAMRTGSLLAQLHTDENGGKTYCDAFQAAVRSHVYFQCVNRGHLWKVIYDGLAARLELHFSRKSPLLAREDKDIFRSGIVDWKWFLFAKAGPDEPGSSPLRKLLGQPIARLVPSKNSSSLLEGSWEVLLRKEFYITITPEGSLVKSWEQKLGLQHEEFMNLMSPTRLKVDAHTETQEWLRRQNVQIIGTYESLPDCGGASGSLHRRISEFSIASEPMFLFLDPEQLGNACLDSYVFATTNHRRQYRENRQIIGKIEAGWHPNKFPKGKKVLLSHHYWEKNNELELKVYQPPQPPLLWSPTELGLALQDNSSCLSSTRTALLVQIPFQHVDQSGWPKGKQLELQLADKSSALQQFNWVVMRAAEEALRLEKWENVRLGSSTTSRCYSCAPPLPTFEYQEVMVARPGKVQGDRTPESIRMENADQAVQYETVLKKRQKPLSAIMHCHDGHLVLEVKLNILTLAHRVLAKLLEPASVNGAHAKVRWRLVYDDGVGEIPPLKIAALLDNSKDTKTEKPSGIRRLKHDLWPRQAKALTWMRRQELDVEQTKVGTAYTQWFELEREEVFIPALKSRVDVEAYIYRHVYGGILADEVGAGKTITSLAHIAQMHDMDIEFAKRSVLDSEGFIRLKATLVLVPQNLLKQWKAEIQECFGKGNEMVIDLCEIKNASELAGTTADRLQRADIILAPWNLFDDEEYWDKLESVCGAENLPTSAGQALQDWLRLALQDLSGRIKTSHGNSCHNIWSELAKSYSKVDMYHRFRGIKDALATRAKKKDEKFVSEEKVVPNFYPLFHLFQFSRLIIDEFTYLEKRSLLAAFELNARSKWLLSGTPPLTNFDKVNMMARLLGTKLVNEDDTTERLSFMNTGQSYAKEKSVGEEFRYYKKARSPAWTSARNDMVDSFVKYFIRKNPTKISLNTRDDVYKVEHLTTVERVTYFEVAQRLMSKSAKFNPRSLVKVKSDETREGRLDKTIQASEGLEDALITSCSAPGQLSLSDTWNEDARELCRKMIVEKKLLVGESINLLYHELRETFYFETKGGSKVTKDNQHFPSYIQRVIENEFGDVIVTELIDRVMLKASIHETKPTETMKKPNLRNGRRKMTIEETASFFRETMAPLAKEEEQKSALKARSEKLNSLTIELVERVRSLRFFQVVQQVLENPKALECDKCKKTFLDVTRARLMGQCGHVACGSCFEEKLRRSDTRDGCFDEQCRAPGLIHQSISLSLLSECRNSKSTTVSIKMTAVIRQILAILNGNPTPLREGFSGVALPDKIIIFVQYPRIREALKEALSNAAISYTDAIAEREYKSGAEQNKARMKVAQKIENFKANKQSDRWTPPSRVCLLQIDSVDAAGWNLQMANHVMFVSPFVADTQYKYEATMAQAVGRAHRAGQKKQVYVYHFLIAHTIEVNILEEREHKKIVEREGCFQLVDKALETDEDWAVGEMQGAVCGAGDLDPGEFGNGAGSGGGSEDSDEE